MSGKHATRIVWAAAIASAVMLYLTGPGINLWPLAFVALVPLIQLARDSRLTPDANLKWKRVVYAAFFAYFLLSLEGLRHAHPLMSLPMIAMAAYLAIYPLLFVVLLRRHHHPIWAGIFWVGGEWVRNYFATGISVLMLGHSLVDMPGGHLLQIADLFGTYGVSLLIVVANYAIADAISLKYRQPNQWKWSIPAAVTLLMATAIYGNISLDHPTTPSDTRVMLIGRDEQTEYLQDLEREQEVFNLYAAQTIQAITQSETPIDAVVWPESMFSGGQPWMTAGADLVVPSEAGGQKLDLTEGQFRQILNDTQREFVNRTRNLQRAMMVANADRDAPSIIGGCGIVRYGKTPQQFSGIIHSGSDGKVAETYAKNHLVMFGEYIPLVKSIPVVREWIPPGLGLDAGYNASLFEVGSLKLLPNLCIETAVERIAVNHLHDEPIANVIVTLTNDAWFDHSRIVDHHLRCAQMVAIGTRRPVLSAANGGPTAWIDSFGKVVQKIPYDQSGTIIATPTLDSRQTLYVQIGSWPAAIAGWAFIAAVLSIAWGSRQRRHGQTPDVA